MAEARDLLAEPSSYLRYLPAIYQDDLFLGRFLRIFEDILAPIHRTVRTVPQSFDPRLAPQPLLDILAGWVGTAKLDRCSEERWRHLVSQTIWLHRWRGTKKGLRLVLELTTGRRPLITEYGSSFTLGQDASLGLNTAVEGTSGPHINVTFTCTPENIDIEFVTGIIRDYKPGHVTFGVSFRPLANEDDNEGTLALPGN